MTKPRSGSTKYRKASTYWLGKELWKPVGKAKRTQALAEQRLGLEGGKIASMVCQTTRGLQEFEFVQISGDAYRDAQLSDEFVFEFGLGPLVQERLLPSQIETYLARRHEAWKIFSDGVARLRKGLFPVTENGRPKKLLKATPEEVEAVMLVWLQKIEALRCLVMDCEDYKHRFMSAAADGTLDVDLRGDLVINLNDPDRLCLITDGGTPYAPYPSRLVPVANATWDEEAGVFVGDFGYL
ncbi:hypothetical protein [Paraburkholderia fynbosensis]|uniref:Uncharacterized protein n=1 Tax=Paraburkholderia fynbosensis TaxID=1200993 RepID=A0A6J5GUG3_9BURK|nr:hypothetical protein [Paraburkholderia fynbosensis]CAB3805040.1 hypothetical protein LMG27177_05757 [Paraburkholderia fynbosensis]